MRPASSFLFIQLSNARAVPAFICVFDYRDDFKYFIRSSVCTIWKNEL